MSVSAAKARAQFEPLQHLTISGHDVSDSTLNSLTSGMTFACVFAAADLWNLQKSRSGANKMDALPVAKSVRAA